ncbi:MAG: amidohydrolase [Desulfobacteraceae bacterium]|nr:amidohydrolase [Desulfobacteraceae bacterium]
MTATNNQPGIINCHAHVLTNKVMPNQLFLYPLPIVPLLRMKSLNRPLLFLLRSLSWLLGKLGMNKLERRLERVVSVVKMSIYETQMDIFNILKTYYSKRTSFVLLSLDTEYMGKGRVPQKYEEQLKGLIEIEKDNPDRVFPFLAIDPRRKWNRDKVEEYIELGFCGIKLYPPHGFKPYDEKYPQLLDIYAYLQENQIPITAHCTPDGLQGRPYKDEDRIFADPDNYKDLLDKYPKLKLCLAHFGGITEWDAYLNDPWEENDKEKAWVSKIIDMIKLDDEDGKPKYPNLYVDISYTAYNLQTHAYLKVLLADDRLKNRVLFGSDFYIVQVETSERAFGIGLRGYLGEEVFDQIARVNPRKFLASDR